MGNQVCCKPNQSECAPSFGTITVNKLSMNPQTEIISQEAENTYLQLQKIHSSNPFLNIPSSQTAQNEIQYRNGMFEVEELHALYNGQWNSKTNKPEGRGRVVFDNGSLLLGCFKDSACIFEHCFFIFKSGEFYEGSIKNNKFSGNGKLIHQLLTYEGSWKNNKPHGKGIQTSKDGDKYVGTFVNGRKSGENCRYIWKDNSKYSQFKGQFQLGKIRGKGVLTLTNGTIIQGVFDQNTIEDVICISQRLECKGQFYKGKLEGKGSVSLKPSREEYHGSFRQGQLYGSCVYTDLKGRKNDCFMFDGKKLKSVVGLSDDEITDILETVEQVYSTVQIHSEALIRVRDQLKDYDCKFIKPFEDYFEKQHYLILHFYEETLLVKKK